MLDSGHLAIDLLLSLCISFLLNKEEKLTINGKNLNKRVFTVGLLFSACVKCRTIVQFVETSNVVFTKTGFVA